MTFPKHTKELSFLLLAISLLYLLFIIFQNRSVIFKTYDAKLFKDKFEHSQWRVPNSKTPISDEELYTYSGYRYIHGENPVLISPEVPPFGKYLIGTSILLFNNQHFASLLAAFGSLFFIYLLTKLMTGSPLAGSIAVFLTSIHSLFTDQIVHSPQMEIFQLFFLLLFAYLFLTYLSSEKKAFLFCTGIVFGLFISLKIFVLFFLLTNGWLVLFYLLKKYPIKKSISDLIIVNLIGLITYALTYFRYFQLGHSLREFLGTQKWIYGFYSNSHINMIKLFGDYLSLIAINHWRFWSAGYPVVHYERWNILWPVVFILGIYSIFAVLKHKKKTQTTLWLLLSFFIIYNIFLFIVPIFPRYLLLLFVPLHIFIAQFATIKRK